MKCLLRDRKRNVDLYSLLGIQSEVDNNNNNNNTCIYIRAQNQRRQNYKKWKSSNQLHSEEY